MVAEIIYHNYTIGYVQYFNASWRPLYCQTAWKLPDAASKLLIVVVLVSINQFHRADPPRGVNSHSVVKKLAYFYEFRSVIIVFTTAHNFLTTNHIKAEHVI
jgi:hypothetical protein